jgi:hypothetical protein|tara:strand:- start:1234 stop:1359 length:126 start_codon:yes stop_codon:yes gene_type:complete
LRTPKLIPTKLKVWLSQLNGDDLIFEKDEGIRADTIASTTQ